jgi:hypothetical protein
VISVHPYSDRRVRCGSIPVSRTPSSRTHPLNTSWAQEGRLHYFAARGPDAQLHYTSALAYAGQSSKIHRLLRHAVSWPTPDDSPSPSPEAYLLKASAVAYAGHVRQPAGTQDLQGAEARERQRRETRGPEPVQRKLLQVRQGSQAHQLCRHSH